VYQGYETEQLYSFAMLRKPRSLVGFLRAKLLSGMTANCGIFEGVFAVWMLGKEVTLRTPAAPRCENLVCAGELSLYDTVQVRALCLKAQPFGCRSISQCIFDMHFGQV